MRSPRARVLCIVLTALTTAVTVAAPVPQLDMPVVVQGPELRGDLSDDVWQQATRVTDFVLMDSGDAPEAATEAFVLCDAESLYVGFICHEPRIEELVTETSGHDGPVGTDDCVGLVIDPPNGETWVYHALVNTIGVYWDAMYTPAGVNSKGLAGITAHRHPPQRRHSRRSALRRRPAL